MRRIRLNLLPGLEVEFADRDGALRRVEDWAREGTRWPIVIFGPEGCGKSAFLRQASVMLRDLGYDVIYVDPLHRFFTAHTDVDEIARGLADAASEAFGVAQLKLATLAIDAVKELLERWGRRRVAVLVDGGLPSDRRRQGRDLRKELAKLNRIPAEELRGDSGRSGHKRGSHQGGNRQTQVGPFNADVEHGQGRLYAVIRGDTWSKAVLRGGVEVDRRKSSHAS